MNEEGQPVVLVKDVGSEEEIDTDQHSKHQECEIKRSEVFKKPLLFVGPRKGKFGGKIRAVSTNSDDPVEGDDKRVNDSKLDNSDPVKTAESEEPIHELKHIGKLSPAEKMKDISIPLPYKEPNWGGIPEELYAFEVLKSGSIVENIVLSSKSFYVFGRLSTCDIHLAHPTVSRFHAVLQYKGVDSKDRPTGFYIYDLGSTHGTFLNKYRIKPNLYVRVHVGHMLKFGGSSRMFILLGPENDMEKESDLTVTELKEKRLQEKAQELAKAAEEEHHKEEEDNKGVDWGMGEDADEETDLTENPFASTQNEELFITDPKKTLRGWFEREGYELEYDVEEKGFGQFLCRVELPIETARGGTVVAEALMKGKKKESVVQCALEACRILDRYGLLRQANHESKKRKAKNWEEEDFYDSDEDTFLDRTGVVEKKRMQRMLAAGKIESQTETYESLLKKHNEMMSELQKLELELHNVTAKINSRAATTESDEEDALDAFMTNLSSEVPDKKLMYKLKNQIASLKQEEFRVRKLVNIARPASLPELAKPKESSSRLVGAKTGPMRRKARNLKSQPSEKVSHDLLKGGSTVDEEEIEEEDEDDENVENKKEVIKNTSSNQEGISENAVSSSNHAGNNTIKAPSRKGASANKNEGEQSSCQEPTSIVKETLSTASKIIGPLLPLCGNSNEPSTAPTNDNNGLQLSPEESNSIVREKIALKIVEQTSLPSEISTDQPLQKKRKRNKNRTSRREENDAKKKYSNDYDAEDPAYSMWVPPEDQSGDGRTKLNDKYGY